MSSNRTQRRWALIFAYFFLMLFIAFLLFPPYYMLITSLKSNQEISSLQGNPLIIQRGATLVHYVDLLTKTLFLRFFYNTVIITVFSVAVTMIISLMAAYSLARMHFFGSTAIAIGIFFTYLVPETLLFLPLFNIFAETGLINSKWVLVLIFPTTTIPFCTWIMLGYFASIPKELDEAALIDGANWYQMLLWVFIPVALPGIIAATIFCFTISWASFLYPLVFVYSSEEMLLTVGTISTLIRGDVQHWGGLMAGALLAAAPPVVLYAFLMDYYIAGLTSGATKG